jgi:DNA modification methylase
MTTNNVTLYHGDCLDILKTLDAGSVQTCVTSPPYYGLRDYGHDGQIGLEETPDAYVAKLVNVFCEVRRVLRDDGTLWLNLGDSYAGSGKGRIFDGTHAETSAKQMSNKGTMLGRIEKSYSDDVIKPKDLMGIPWMVAFALRADGWWLRSDIIWHKPNPMPESVKDRPTKAHEYIFLLSKSDRYFYDADAVREPHAKQSINRMKYKFEPNQVGKYADGHKQRFLPEQFCHSNGRNKRSVWTVTTKPYAEAHFATYPPDLIEPCILAGSKPGDIVLDPFNGSGTTGAVAVKHGRQYVGIELNPDYIELAQKRIADAKLPLLETGG